MAFGVWLLVGSVATYVRIKLANTPFSRSLSFQLALLCLLMAGPFGLVAVSRS